MFVPTHPCQIHRSIYSLAYANWLAAQLRSEHSQDSQNSQRYEAHLASHSCRRRRAGSGHVMLERLHGWLRGLCRCWRLRSGASVGLRGTLFLVSVDVSPCYYGAGPIFVLNNNITEE